MTKATKKREAKMSRGLAGALSIKGTDYKKTRVDEVGVWTRYTTDRFVFYSGPNGEAMGFPLKSAEKEKRG
jgi:hypothetical protein